MKLTPDWNANNANDSDLDRLRSLLSKYGVLCVIVLLV